MGGKLIEVWRSGPGLGSKTDGRKAELEIFFQGPGAGGNQHKPTVVVQIRVTSAYFRTASGISVNSSLAEIKKVYPHSESEEDKDWEESLPPGSDKSPKEGLVDQVAFSVPARLLVQSDHLTNKGDLGDTRGNLDTMNETPVGENVSASAGSAVVRPGRPIVTYAVMGLCLLIFAWASADREGMFLHLVEPIRDLPSGWWALFSTALVHIEVSHLVFNLVAFLALGQIVELTAGKIRFAILLLLLAWMASFSQRYFEPWPPAIGLSGVVYGVFGFMLGAAPVNRFYLWFVKKNAAMLIGWAILCVILTQFKLLNIANAAHFGGLIFGTLCGLYYGLPRFRWVFATLILGLLVWSILIVFGR